MGWGYVPLDAREYVYSAVKDCVVQNVVVDVYQHTTSSLRIFIEQQLLRQFPRVRRIKWMVFWASEDCSTFSKMDQINKRRGTVYRDAAHPHRPPLNQETSSYGAKAAEADAHGDGAAGDPPAHRRGETGSPPRKKRRVEEPEEEECDSRNEGTADGAEVPPTGNEGAPTQMAMSPERGEGGGSKTAEIEMTSFLEGPLHVLYELYFSRSKNQCNFFLRRSYDLCFGYIRAVT